MAQTGYGGSAGGRGTQGNSRFICLGDITVYFIFHSCIACSILAVVVVIPAVRGLTYSHSPVSDGP